jgi:hypothetical protein
VTDVFALQDEVTVAVVSAIQPKLLQTEIVMAARRRPENLTAYDFFLRAMQQYYLSTREGNGEAMRLAHRALELDPRFGFVAALAGICHMSNVVWGYAIDPQVEREEAVRPSRWALSVDDSDPDTLAWAATISAFMVGDNESAMLPITRHMHFGAASRFDIAVHASRFLLARKLLDIVCRKYSASRWRFSGHANARNYACGGPFVVVGR